MLFVYDHDEYLFVCFFLSSSSSSRYHHHWYFHCVFMTFIHWIFIFGCRQKMLLMIFVIFETFTTLMIFGFECFSFPNWLSATGIHFKNIHIYLLLTKNKNGAKITKNNCMTITHVTLKVSNDKWISSFFFPENFHSSLRLKFFSTFKSFIVKKDVQTIATVFVFVCLFGY